MSNKHGNLLVNLIDVYWDDPVAFVQDILQVNPDEWQSETLAALATKPKVSVRSGQGVGKTALEAWSVIWFLCCRPNPKVICTAPTKQQLHDVLWAEIAKWLEGTLVNNFLKWTKTKVYMIGNEERWFATARTATKPENIQGFHEDFMLFVVDEASGVADSIMEAILGTLSGAENKLLMCGNPTRTSGVFYDSHHRDRIDYQTLKVSSYDSKRTNKDNIASLLRKYGRDSDVARVRIFGEFPKGEPDAFISLFEVEKATRRVVYVDDDGNLDIPYSAVLSIGVDVARFGSDETTIFARIGKKVLGFERFQGQDTMKTAGEAIKKARELMREYSKLHCTINVDDDGVGGGVTDRLNEVVLEEGYNITINRCSNGARANNSESYDDWGTESWAVIKELLEDIEIPNDDELIAQLTSRKYRVTSKGKIKLERKEDMKRRGLPSPDRADGLALAFANTEIEEEYSGVAIGGKLYG
ncbi:terminase B [Lysinibacillus mangiferihumi]|uniref:Terminase B n=1 Tax=Lysinibacillus mangiferihumi TaxID=1130819 RepID=A0A4V6X6C2_9BACI|nr:DEAD/DEAH box helicase family protein [Lysinibacillus mangiferihumi]TKI72633.1 terminase B [Lysinibacillus mangiferihumi]